MLKCRGYTVESLLAALPPLENLSYGEDNLGVLLKSAIAALDDNERRLLVAMAACAPGGVGLEFAAEVASLDQRNSLNALQGLYSRSLVIELDRRVHLYRFARNAAGGGVTTRGSSPVARPICPRAFGSMGSRPSESR